MARHHAPLLTSIWDDEDFCALPALAQRLYMQLLSQKRLSMVGVVPYSPRNWSRGCTELSIDDVLATLDILVETRYVLIDEDTEELLVRTILKHDPPRGAKSLRGMWNAWLEVDSKPLRRAILENVTDEMWSDPHVDPPKAANDLRNAPLDAPSDDPPDAPSDGASLARASHRPPSTVHLAAVRDEPPSTPSTPTPAATAPGKRARNELWDALTAAIGEAKTKTEQSNRGKTVNELVAAGATPADVLERCAEYRRRWPNMELTDAALRNHWSKLKPRSTRSGHVSSNSPGVRVTGANAV